MVLAQPTDLQVQSLTPLVTLEQDVRRHLPARTLVTLAQYTGGLRPARTLVTVAQDVRRYTAERTLVQLDQGVYVYTPARTLVTLDQTVVFLREQSARSLVTLEQKTQRHLLARRLFGVRQVVFGETAPGAGVAPEQALVVTLDGVDITDRCARPISITASEGANRTASVIYRPPFGPINITSYQGREVTIDRLQDGALVPLFRGRVDVPTYARFERTLTLSCSDIRSERLGREEHDHLLTLTGGIYSDVTQTAEAEGERWVRELMKTVSGSLDYAGDGSLRYRPWALGAVTHTLEAGDIHHREVALDFVTRSELVNKVKAVIQYRYYRKRTFNETTGWSIPKRDLCNGGVCLPELGYAWPRKDTLENREGGMLGGWRITGVTTESPPPSGWYRRNPLSTPIAYISNDNFRKMYAVSASLSLVRWVSQAQRLTKNIAVVAPESIDQFGEIDGGEMRFALETDIDPGVFEQDGCSIGPDNDRASDYSTAIDAVQAMATKQILAGHRKNQASFRYKPKTGRPGAAQLLPVEIGDVISVTSDEVTVLGFVSDFEHEETTSGDRWTDVTLAVSRVDSAVSVVDGPLSSDEAENFALNFQSAKQPNDVPQCGSSENASSGGSGDIDESGKMTFKTPSISKDLTDEVVSTTSRFYQISIPRNTFDVEVP